MYPAIIRSPFFGTDILNRNGLDLLLPTIKPDQWLCFFDVDGLKQINERYGKLYAGKLISICIEVRITDQLLTVGQWYSGDEFVAVFNTKFDAIGYAQRTQAHMHQSNYSATFAIVQANYRKNVRDTINFADELVALLKQRFNRRNCIIIV